MFCHGSHLVEVMNSPSKHGRVWYGAISVGLAALAVVLVVVGIGRNVEDQGVVLEAASSSDYLGDPHALSSVDARRQANSMFTEMA